MEHSPVTNLASSVAKRHWSSFAVELVLIVIGILAALYIDSWVGEREDRRLEVVYLEAIISDLDTIETAIAEQERFEEVFLDAANAAYRTVTDRENGYDVPSLASQLSVLTVRRTLWVDSPSYSDLLSTGNVGLIADREVRTALLRYFDSMERLELIVAKNNRDYIDSGFMPYARDMGFQIGNDELLGIQRDDGGSHVALDAQTTERVLAAMTEQDWFELEVQIHYRAINASTFVLWSRRALEETRSIREQLQTYTATR